MTDANSKDMTRILLSGSLAKAFGREHFKLLDTGTAQEAFSALKHTVDGFEDFIREASRRGLRFAIFRNRKNVGEDDFSLSGTTEIRIVPVISGSKAGLFQTVIGIVLIVVAAVMIVGSGGTATPLAASLMSAGIAMTIGGIVQMLTPVPKTPDQAASPENKPSYLFNGAFNSSQQGLPVPVVYGQMLVGSSVIAVGTWSEALPV